MDIGNKSKCCVETKLNAKETVTLQSNCGNLNVQIKIISDCISLLFD